MNEIGQGEQIDPSWGVYNWRVRDYLNSWLGTNHPLFNLLWVYIESTDATKTNLKSYILTDIDQGWGMESASVTKRDDGEVMSGWPTSMKVKHIVALRGYVMGTSRFVVHYIESGQSAQGYGGSFYQQLSLTKFFSYVNAYDGDPVWDNNSQVW